MSCFQNVTENDFGATPAAVGIVGTLTLLVASLGLWGIIRKVKLYKWLITSLTFTLNKNIFLFQIGHFWSKTAISTDFRRIFGGFSSVFDKNINFNQFYLEQMPNRNIRCMSDYNSTYPNGCNYRSNCCS